MTSGANPFSELGKTMMVLRKQGCAGIVVGELVHKLIAVKGPAWVAESWNASKTQLSDIMDPSAENIDAIVEQYVSKV